MLSATDILFTLDRTLNEHCIFVELHFSLLWLSLCEHIVSNGPYSPVNAKTQAQVSGISDLVHLAKRLLPRQLHWHKCCCRPLIATGLYGTA